MRKLLLFAGAVSLLIAPALAADLVDQSVAGATPELAGSGGLTSGMLPATDNDRDFTTYSVQWGGGSYSGIYAATPSGETGWQTVSETGDMNVDAWCDIEMYLTETIANQKVYFHIADNTTQMTAYISGSFSSCNGMWMGIAVPAGSDMTLFTGSKDVLDRDISDKSFPCEWGLTDQGDWGTYRTADSVGYGDNNSVEAMWWLINSGASGYQDYQWKLTILPAAYQADGHYHLDPAVTIMPAL